MVIRFGQIELDEERFLLRRGAERIDLRPKVFDLLLFLIRNRERVVLREELVETLWDRTTVGLGSLSGLVNELRQALGESGRGESSIRTVHARGYQFVAPVELVEAPMPLPAPLADALVAHVRDADPDLASLASWLRTQLARAQADSHNTGAELATIPARRRTIGSRDSNAAGVVASEAGEGRTMKKVEPGSGSNRVVAGEAWPTRARVRGPR